MPNRPRLMPKQKKRIREAIIESGEKAKDVARAYGIHSTTVSRIAGKRPR